MSGFMGNAPRAANTALIRLMELEREKPNFLEAIEQELAAKERYVLERLKNISTVAEIYPRDACFNYAVRFNYSGTDMQLAEALMRNGTLFMPASGYGYKAENCVMRITFAERVEKLEQGMDRVTMILKDQQ